MLRSQMRRIETLKIKKPANINQINPLPIHNLGCFILSGIKSYFQGVPYFSDSSSTARTHEHGPTRYCKTILTRRRAIQGPNFPNNLHHANHRANFPSQASSSSFQNSPLEKKLSKLEDNIEALMKSQTPFMQNQGQTLNNHSQAISTLEI